MSVTAALHTTFAIRDQNVFKKFGYNKPMEVKL